MEEKIDLLAIKERSQVDSTKNPEVGTSDWNPRKN
jgi:hypothetical protein